MAGATQPSSGGHKGFLSKLNPKQKRALAIAALAALLALGYLMLRGRHAGGEAQEAPEGEGIRSGQFGAPVGAAGGENAAALSDLGENLAGQFGQLAEQQGTTQQMLGETGAEVMGVRQGGEEFQRSQEEANERWLGNSNKQTKSLHHIEKLLERKSPHARHKHGEGQKGSGKKPTGSYGPKKGGGKKGPASGGPPKGKGGGPKKGGGGGKKGPAPGGPPKAGGGKKKKK